MNNQLSFVNKEVLNPIAFTVLGASVKNDASCVGFFGSGMKYAIAVMLRHNVNFSIKTHGKEYKFTTEKRDFRGEDIELILCNGNDLGYTTDFGKTWHLEQAFRELYCNTLDEGGTVEVGGGVDASQQTVIAIDDHRMNEHYYARHDNFLFDSAPIFTTEDAEIHPLKDKENDKMFYKGVKVKTHYSGMLYRYNVKTNCDLTEDRTLKYDFQWNEAVAELLSKLTDEVMIKRVLTAPKDSLEERMSYSEYSIKNHASSEFMAIAEELHAKGKLHNKSLGTIIQALNPVNIEDQAEDLTPQEEELVQECYSLLETAGYYTQGFELVKFKSEKGNLLGQAKDGKIFIEAKCFKLGPRELAITILEEFFHLKTGMVDETRSFQNYLFEQIGLLMENNKDLKEKLNYQLA